MLDTERYDQYIRLCEDRGTCPYSFDQWKRVIDKIKPSNADKYPHYFPELPQRVTHLDVYRVLKAFQVTDPCISHALKKMLCSGIRGAKNMETDIKEAIDSLQRALEMIEEEKEPEL